MGPKARSLLGGAVWLRVPLHRSIRMVPSLTGGGAQSAHGGWVAATCSHHLNP